MKYPVLLVAGLTCAHPVHSVKEVRTVFDGGGRGDAGFNANLRRELRALGLRFVRTRKGADAVLHSEGSSTPRGGFSGVASLTSPTGKVLWSARIERAPGSRTMAFSSLAANLRATWRSRQTDSPWRKGAPLFFMLRLKPKWVALLLVPLAVGVGLANLDSWRPRRVPLAGSPFQVAFSPDGRYVASVGGSGVDVWRAVSPSRFAAPRVEGHRAWAWADEDAGGICFSGDSRTLVSVSPSSIGNSYRSGIVYRWDMATGRAAPPAPHYGDTVSCVHPVPGTGDVAFWTGSFVEQRNVRSWKVTREVDLRGEKDLQASPIKLVAFSPDGHLTAWPVYDQSGAIVLRDGAGQTTRLPPLIVPSPRLTCDVTALTFSPDSRFLAVGWSAAVYDAKGNDVVSSRVTMWDLKSRTLAAKWMEGAAQIGAHAFSPDGATLAAAWENANVSLRDAHSGKLLRLLEMAGTRAARVAFSPDGTTLAGCGDDSALYLWRVK